MKLFLPLAAGCTSLVAAVPLLGPVLAVGPAAPPGALPPARRAASAVIPSAVPGDSNRSPASYPVLEDRALLVFASPVPSQLDARPSEPSQAAGEEDLALLYPDLDGRALAREHYRLDELLRWEAEWAGVAALPEEAQRSFWQDPGRAQLVQQRDWLAGMVWKLAREPGPREMPPVHPRAAPQDLERFYRGEPREDLAEEAFVLRRAWVRETARLIEESLAAGSYEATWSANGLWG